MKNFIFSLFVLISLTGCKSDEAYNNAIQKGLDYTISEEYQKSESAFELALDEKKNDEKATALLEQTVYYQELIKEFEAGDFDIAKESANKIIKIEDGSSALVKKSQDYLDKTEGLEAILKVSTEIYEGALSQFEDKKYSAASTELEEISNRKLEHPIFNLLNENIEKLNEDIESALLVEKKEKEEKEKIAQEKAEQEEQEEQIRKDNQSKESTNMKSEEELIGEVTALIEKEFGYYIEEDPYVYYSELVENNLLSIEVRAKAGVPGAETLSIMGMFLYSGDTEELWIFDAAASKPDYYLYE